MMLREVFGWWLRQMLDLTGICRDGWLGRWRMALVIDGRHHGEMVTLTHRQNRRESLIGRYRLDEAGLSTMRRALGGRARRNAVVLRLPADMLLEQQVAVPLLAEREAERVLGYGMDRLTPFAAAEIFWDWAVERRDRASGRLHLRLSLIPRAGLQPLLASLSRIGLVPAFLEAAAPDGTPRLIALEHPRKATKRRLTTIAAVCCVLLALVAIIQPFVLQANALSQVDGRLAELQPQMKLLEGLRRQIAARSADTDIIAAERGRVGDPLAVLATVTDILPDDAYLTGFSMSQRKLALSGQAGAAARLIAAMAADPTLRNPTFAAPVVHEARGRAELFSIHAELGP